MSRAQSKPIGAPDEVRQVYVSATTHELVAGAGLVFEDAGIHELKGISGPRQLFALVEGAR